jgi:hypothetical protein
MENVARVQRGGIREIEAPDSRILLYSIVCAQPYHFVPSGLFRLSALITSDTNGRSSSIQLFGQLGSFSKVSFNHAAEFKPY